MSASAKREKNGTWRIQYRYTDWTGQNKKSQKRGFKTKREAEEWLAAFKLQQAGDVTMRFSDFWKIYREDMEKRLRKTTLRQKEYVVIDKLLPYFGNTPLCEITAPMIRKWQGEMMEKGYKETYLKTINNQLCAILNYAVRYYDLKSNPCHKAGSMGKARADKMPFWTTDEFARFEAAIIDKRPSWMAFNILFWTGMRLGELLALTVGDFDFDAGTVSVSKSFVRIDGEDLITPPKTKDSIRTITMPEQLSADVQDYISTLYRAKPGTRLFSSITKSYLETEMKRGVRESGVKPIHIHCIRHSHASMLVQMGFSPLEIANRLGHGRVTTTIETYCHPAEDAQIRIAERLSGIGKGESIEKRQP